MSSRRWQRREWLLMTGLPSEEVASLPWWTDMPPNRRRPKEITINLASVTRTVAPPAWNLNVYTYQWLQQRLNLSSVELVLWTEHQQERRGESGRGGWRVTKVAAIARVRFIGRNIQLQITSVQQRRHFSLKLTWMKFKSPPPPPPPLFGFFLGGTHPCYSSCRRMLSRNFEQTARDNRFKDRCIMQKN